MKAIVTYGADGKIATIAKAATDSPVNGLKASPVPAEGLLSVEVELPEHLAGTPLRDIHDEYRLDPVTAKLVKRSPEIAI